MINGVRRVAAWYAHKLGYILDPADSYHADYDPNTELPEDRVFMLIKHYQPMAWPLLLSRAGMPAKEVRDITNDLIDEGIVQTSSYGLFIVDHKEDNVRR